MAKICGCKTKTLYPYELFGSDNYDSEAANVSKATYDSLIGNLKIQDFKSSLSIKLTNQEEVDIFNTCNSHKTGTDLTIEYLQNDMEFLSYCMND